jgi:hypothetical protein
MIKNKINLKQKIAREILIFFSGLVIIGLVWGFFFFSNLFYQNRINSCLKSSKSLQKDINSLPKEYINQLYKNTNSYFVINYKIGKSFFSITKEQNKNFLSDEYGIPKNVTRLPINSKGYSYSQIDVFKEFGGYELNPKQKDSTIYFDFVDYNKFLVFIKLNDYQEKFYLDFSKDSKRRLVRELEKPKFDLNKPYNEIFDLGTLDEFKSKVNIDLKVIQKKKKIKREIKKQQELVLISKNNLFTTNEIKNHLINTLIVIGLFLYPIRFSIFLILWAFNTIKKK